MTTKEDTNQHADSELAASWDDAAEAIEHDPMRPIRYGKCFAYVQRSERSLHFLEIGCGEGTGLLFASQMGFHNLAGCEISAERLRRARAKLRTQITLKSVDGSGSLPFDTASFDGAYSTAVIEHTISPSAFMQEIARVVKPGGTVVISSDCWQWRILQLLGIYQSAQPIDRAMTTEGLLSLFRSTGFEVLHFDGFPLQGEEFRFLRLLTSWVWKNPFSARVIARLRRFTRHNARIVTQSSRARSLEQEYDIFVKTAEGGNSQKPRWLRYMHSMFSDENVFLLRRK